MGARWCSLTGQNPNRVFAPEDVYGKREYEKVAAYVAEVYQGEPVKAARIAEALDLAYWKVQARLRNAARRGLLSGGRRKGWIPVNGNGDE